MLILGYFICLALPSFKEDFLVGNSCADTCVSFLWTGIVFSFETCSYICENFEAICWKFSNIFAVTTLAYVVHLRPVPPTQ